MKRPPRGAGSAACLLATICVVCGIEPAASEIVPIEFTLTGFSSPAAATHALGLTDLDPATTTATERIGLSPSRFSQWRPLAMLQRTRLPQPDLPARVSTPSKVRGNLLEQARSSLSTLVRMSHRIQPLVSVRAPLKGIRGKRALEHVEPRLRRLAPVYRVGLNLTF